MNTVRRNVATQSATRSLAILVVGMHRSGTSVLTRILNLLGADIGKNLLGTAAENPTGFWESEEMVNLHNELLQSAGTSWDDPIQFPVSWYDSPLEPVFRQRMVALLRADFPASALFVIKDPRICKLLPFWRRVLDDFGADAAAVLPLRNPIEVAASLKERNKFSTAKSMLLWMRYLIDAERNTRDLPRSVLSYEVLGRNWRTILPRISRDLNISWPRQSLHVAVEIDELVQPSLRHFKADPGDLQSDPTINAWIKTLYAAALAEEEGKHGALSEAVDAIAAVSDKAEQIYGPVIAETLCDRQSAEARAKQAVQHAAEQMAAQSAQAAAERETEAAQFAARLAEESETREKIRDDAAKQIATAQQEKVALEAEIEKFKIELRDFRNDLAGRNIELQRLLSALHDKEAAIDCLEAELALTKEAAQKRESSEAALLPPAEPIIPAPVVSRAPKIIPAPTLIEKVTQVFARTAGRPRSAPDPGKEINPVHLKLLKESVLFDAAYYYARYPDIAAHGGDPAEHYLSHGAEEGRWPHPLFDPEWYAGSSAEQGAEPNPLVNFILHGAVQDRSPHLLFDSKFYHDSYLDIKRHGLNPLQHYLEHGAAEGRNPHPLFSTQWYLYQYPDVGQNGINPLIDFVSGGLAAGRRSHPAFDAEFYLAQYPDVAAAGVNPLVHYLTKGAAEGRNPSALFDAKAYLRDYPDIAERKLPPLAHYLSCGMHEGRKVHAVRNRHRWANAEVGRPFGDAVNVIIPAYKGLDEIRRCIDSVLLAQLQNTTPHSILVIDDCSPEPELSRYLQMLADQRKILLLKNEKNLGFVGSVNCGINFNLDRDVILLNSDTEVANDWVDRLRRAAYADPGVATVTPFSNNGTICSFPVPNEDNQLPAGMSVAEIDAVFASINTSAAVEMPTGVGFCMYVRSEALKEIGLLDAETYGKGYGEENDFCMRALKKGWRHVLAADTFVHHVGEVSFAAGSHAGKRKATEILTAHYPTYEGLIRAHVQENPARRFRQNASVSMLRRSGKPVILAISHNRGGGTEKHIRDVAELTKGRCHTLLLRRDSPSSVRIDSLDDPALIEAMFDPFAERYELLQFLQSLNLRRIHVHHLLNNELYLPSLLETLHVQFGIPYDVTLHDFYFLAPNPHLINEQGIFIGEPDEENGAQLLHGASELNLPASLSEWRKRHHSLLAGAQRIIAPSQDTARRFLRYYPDFKVIVAHHPEAGGKSSARVEVRPLAGDEPLRIAILGAMGPEKGINVLEAVAELAMRQDLPLVFHVIGQTARKMSGRMMSRVIVHGPYKQEELAGILERVQAHAAWFPSQCPETFCYTLGEAMQAGLPIVASDLGALSERLEGRAWSWRGRWDQTPEQWIALLMAVREHFRRREAPAVLGTSVSKQDFYPREFLSWIPA